MASDDPIARRRRIAEKGSDRLAMITGGRAQNLHSPPSDTSTAQPHDSHTESYPSSLTHHPDQPLPSGKVFHLVFTLFHVSSLIRRFFRGISFLVVL